MKAYFKSVWLVALVLTCASSATAQAPAKQADLKTIRAELTTLRADWLKHRTQKIAVLDIDGLKADSSKDEKKILERRLETLQNKKISNREWATYWKLEASFAAKISVLYSQLAPSKGSSMLKVEQVKKAREAEAAGITERSKHDAYQKVRATREKAEVNVREMMNTNASAVRETLAELEKLQKKVEQASAKITRIDNQLKQDLSDRRKAALTEAKTNAATELGTIETQYTELKTKSDALDATQKSVAGVLTGAPIPATGLEPAAQETLTQFVAARAAVDLARRELTAAQDLSKRLSDESTLARLEFERYSARRPVLTKWEALAQRKVKNQDLYYNAIEADIAAVNDRLRSVRKTEKKEEQVYAEDVCYGSLKDGETPYAHQRSCTRAIRDELRNLRTEFEQAKQKEKLTKRLRDSITKLIAAQVTDETLVRLEASISGGEKERSAQAKNETSAWRDIWTIYAGRAEKKKVQLTNAVLTSKVSERTLNARLGVYGDALKRLTEQQKKSETYLLDTDTAKNTLVALLTTGWQILTVGWPALIYLLIAFFLIRFVRRHRDRQEQKALLAQEGEGNEELNALEAELERARRDKDEEEIIQLTEEIGKMENRVKDEGQRIATVARVAAQALTLVIYIATTLLMLDALTVDIKPILGGAAIFGLAISFGSQSLVKDVVSGFFILLENQYAVGDVVTINGQSGGVEKVTLRRTVLRDVKGGVHNITNGSISSVTNSTQGWARAVIHLGVAYGTDIDKVSEVINAVGEEMYADPKWHGKLTEKPSFVGVTAFGESEITVRAMFKTRTFHNWSAEREFNVRIKAAFEEAGIDIPFPQRELRIVREVEVPKKTD